MKKILVTGGTGLVGSHLLYRLLSGDNDIYAIKRNNSDTGKTLKILSYYGGNYQELFNKINWIDVDIVNSIDVNEKLPNDLDEIYHCAALVSYLKKDKDAMLETNVDGTANIVNFSLVNNIKKFCYVSSIASLGGSIDGEPIVEESEWVDSDNISAYSKSKFYAENEVWRGIAEGLDAVIVNPSVILGAGNWKSSSSAVFPIIHKNLKFFTRGVTGFVDVRDLVEIMIRLTDKNKFNERFIVSSENVSYEELFSFIADSLNVAKPKIYANKKLTSIAWRVEFLKSLLLGVKPVITKQSATTSHKILKYSNDKITKTLNFKFKTIADSVQEIGGIYLDDIKN